jgi:hypothetical protein
VLKARRNREAGSRWPAKRSVSQVGAFLFAPLLLFWSLSARVVWLKKEREKSNFRGAGVGTAGALGVRASDLSSPRIGRETVYGWAAAASLLEFDARGMVLRSRRGGAMGEANEYVCERKGEEVRA